MGLFLRRNAKEPLRTTVLTISRSPYAVYKVQPWNIVHRHQHLITPRTLHVGGGGMFVEATASSAPKANCSSLLHMYAYYRTQAEVNVQISPDFPLRYVDRHHVVYLGRCPGSTRSSRLYSIRGISEIMSRHVLRAELVCACSLQVCGVRLPSSPGSLSDLQVPVPCEPVQTSRTLRSKTELKPADMTCRPR